MSTKPAKHVPMPMKCPICRERQVDFVTEAYETTIEHDGRPYHLSFLDMTMLKCGNCSNRILPMESCDRISDATRDAAGFLYPSMIRERRSSLGITQVRMAALLNVGEATLSRWETGAQIQSHHMDVMLRAFFEVPAFREYLEARLHIHKEVSPKPSRTAVNEFVKMTLTRPVNTYPYVNAVREDSNKIESGV